jgi:hypothetical protein
MSKLLKLWMTNTILLKSLLIIRPSVIGSLNYLH